MSLKLQEYKDTIEKNLRDRSKPWTKYFDLAEEKTGVSRVYLFVGESRLPDNLFITLAVYLTFILCRQESSHSPVYI